MVGIESKADGESEHSIDPVLEIGSSSSCADKGIEKPYGGEVDFRTATEKSKEENILQIYREKHNVLMEANAEKGERLHHLEKEFNNHNIQHNEGISWLRLQLDTSRREKDAADERIADLQKELRLLNSDRPPRTISLDPTITDSVGNGDEKLNSITRLQNRLEKYECSFGIMEYQMAMMKSSSGEIIKMLKEEIASLMEDRSRVELELLNQLSELDDENRRRKLEYTLELHNKDETIETLRNLKSCSIFAEGQQTSSSCTQIYSGSSSTKDTRSSMLGCKMRSSKQANDDLTDKSRVCRDESSEKAELQRKLDEAHKELKKLRSDLLLEDRSELINEKRVDSRPALEVKDNPELVQHISEERRAIDMTMERVQTILESSEATVLSLKGTIENLKTNNAGTDEENERILSVLDSASLVHEEAKLSILLTELKLQNEFDILKTNRLMNHAGYQPTPDKQEVINDLKDIQNDFLIELVKAKAEFSRQIRDLQRSKILGNSKLGDLNHEIAPKPAIAHGSKPSKTSPTPVVDKLLLSYQANCDSGNGSIVTGDSIMISRDALHFLEEQLHQIAERMFAKNQKIALLKKKLERHKIRESGLRNELRASIKCYEGVKRNGTKAFKDVSSKSKAVKHIGEIRDSMFPQNIPQEIHAKSRGSPIALNGVSSESSLSNERNVKVQFKGATDKRRKGMTDDSQEGGTNPITPTSPITKDDRCDSIGFVPSLSSDDLEKNKPIAPTSPITKGDRCDSIGFVPSPSSDDLKNNRNSTSEKPMKGRRLQPTSREIKKLVFLPPCFS